MRSSTFRLALYYVGLFTLSVLFLFGFIYWSTAANLARQTDATIDAEIKGLAERYQTDGLPGLSNQIRDRIGRQQPTGLSIYLLADGRYQPVMGNLDRWPGNAEELEGGWIRFDLTDTRGTEETVHAARARTFRLPSGFRLLVGRDIRELTQAQARIVKTLAWGVGIMLLLGLAGGYLMSRSATRRIEAINLASRDIMSGDLSRRIPTRGSNDDFDQLAGQLNHMLDRIESLMESVRRVSDNIAHDLKTPLSRLRNRLEEARLRSDDSVAVGEMLDSAVADTDQLLSTFNALLRIARVEAHRDTSTFMPVDLGELVTDLAELYEPLAEEHRQRLVTNIEQATRVTGDRDLLFQALANLTDNAVKHTPDGGVITVTVGLSGGCPKVMVTDSGPGIPQEYAGKVLQRFFRLDRSRNTPGAGLGLSLVDAVARVHDAELRLENMEPGLRVILRFPKQPPASH